MPDTPARENPPRDPELVCFEGLHKSFQMWLESYNVYHLIDGHSQLMQWGSIMPHILNSPKNREALAAKVMYALEEDSLDTLSLSPE